MRVLASAVVIVILVAFSLAQESPRTRNEFSISGYVVNNDGNLVAGAEVHAVTADIGGLESMSLTQAGRFTVAVTRPGRYWLYSLKDDKGYREISEALIRLDPESIPEVIVTERSPNQVALIRLRSSAARLRMRLVDSITRLPLEKAQLVVTRNDSNKQYIRSLNSFDKNGTITLLLPSILPLRIRASAPGYQHWVFINAGEQSANLLLAPDETREITVGLRPLKRAK
jgi:hypothetical protein